VHVSWFGLKTKVNSFSWFGLKTGGFGFPDLGIKTDSCGLVIWPQNHHDDFLVWASKPCGLQFVGCATKPMEG
jgi:hypothetical protein